jgi:hypothetical protein
MEMSPDFCALVMCNRVAEEGQHCVEFWQYCCACRRQEIRRGRFVTLQMTLKTCQKHLAFMLGGQTDVVFHIRSPRITHVEKVGPEPLLNTDRILRCRVKRLPQKNSPVNLFLFHPCICRCKRHS